MAMLLRWSTTSKHDKQIQEILAGAPVRPSTVQEYLCHVDNSTGKVLGVAWMNEGLGYFDFTVIVHPAHRGIGIGTLLIKTVAGELNTLVTEGLLELAQVDVTFVNAQAERIWKKALLTYPALTPLVEE